MFFLFYLLLLCEFSYSYKSILNFQIYEHENNYKAELQIHPFISLKSDFKLLEKTKKHEKYKTSIELEKPFSLKINGSLNKIKISKKKTKLSSQLNISNYLEILFNSIYTKQQKNHDLETSFMVNFLESNLKFNYLKTLRYNEINCPKITLYHNLTSNLENLIYFNSDITNECGIIENEDIINKMFINIDFKNIWNNLFNFNLKQIFHNGKKNGFELMEMINTIYKIKVKGDYDNKNDYKFIKKATFKSKFETEFPSFEINYHNDKEKEDQISFCIMKKKNNL